MRYLIRKKQAKVAHIWQRKDTSCRMHSTGGLNPKKYKQTTLTNGLPVCANCLNNMLLAKQGKGHNAKRRRRWERKDEVRHGIGGGPTDYSADAFVRKHGGW